MNFADLGIAALPLLAPGLIAPLVFSFYLRQPFLLTTFAFIAAVAFTKGSQLAVVAAMPTHFGSWQSLVEFFAALAIATVGGLGAGEFTRRRDQNRRSNRAKPDKAHSDPMRWNAIFRGERKHLMLQMKDGRTIVGWPEGWPHDHQHGHFFLINPRVIGEKANELGYSSVAVVIPAADVILVRFLRDDPAKVASAWDEMIRVGEEGPEGERDVNVYR